VNSVSAKARFIHKDIDVTGLFHFDEEGKFIRFETCDRYYSEKGGKFVKKRFSAIVDSYGEKDGMQLPDGVRIVWHLENGDYEYFKGKVGDIIYNIVEC
jgi:hypothetical protein